MASLSRAKCGLISQRIFIEINLVKYELQGIRNIADAGNNFGSGNLYRHRINFSSWRTPVTQTRFIATVLAGLLIAGFASQALAQKGESKRDAAMEKCLQEAGKVSGELQQMTRTAIYKACMSKAGFKP